MGLSLTLIDKKKKKKQQEQIKSPLEKNKTQTLIKSNKAMKQIKNMKQVIYSLNQSTLKTKTNHKILTQVLPCAGLRDR